MRDASFAGAGVFVGPITLDLEPGESAALSFDSARQAAVAALIAAGVVKASQGCVLIGDYDPRIQSVACKRIAGFVPHEPLHLSERAFARYIAYRAALWNVELDAAFQKAELVRERLSGVPDAIAMPLIGALLAAPRLLAIDRPRPEYVSQIRNATGGCAVLSTHCDAARAQSFEQLGARSSTPA